LLFAGEDCDEKGKCGEEKVQRFKGPEVHRQKAKGKRHEAKGKRQ